MANFVFLTFYDKICLGPRILCSTLKSAGHQSKLIIFKDEITRYQFFKKKGKRVNYECYVNGIVKGMHFDVDPWTQEEISLLTDLVMQLNPDVLCISTRSFWTELGAPLVAAIRNKLPKIPVVSGGWGPSLEPEKYLKYCDYVCFGEGEETVLDMGRALDEGKDFKHIKNMIYKADDQMVHNAVREPVRNMDAVAFPDVDPGDVFLISNNQILTGQEFYNEKMYDIFLGRGCPMSCSYCMSGKWKGLYMQHDGLRYPKVRLRSPERCIEELLLAKCRGALFIRFKDEVFPYHRKWLDRFLDLYKEKINLPFFAYLAAEFHKPDMVHQLYDAGMRTAGLGIQSASDDILNRVYHRPRISQKFRKLAQVLDEKRIGFGYDVICHSPFETAAEMKKTFHYLCTLPIAELLVFKLNFFPGAPISRMIETQEPTPEKENVYRWYAILFSMTGKSKLMRYMAVFIEKYGLFRLTPGLLQVLFGYYLIKEKIRELRAKRRYRTISRTIPGMLKRAGANVFIPAGLLELMKHFISK